MAKTDQILVTGATGIAGHHVARALEEHGVAVLRTSRNPRGHGTAMDVTDASALERLPDFAGVVHCAGLTPRVATTSWAEYHRSNVVGSVNVANEAVRRGARSFVYINTGGRLRRRNVPSATRHYVISKYLAERCIRQILRGRVPAVSFRCASLYGEHDRGSMSRLILTVAAGRLLLPSRGVVTKCLLYAGSLASVVGDTVMSGSATGWMTRRVSDLRPYTLVEIVETIEKVVGRRVRKIPVSPELMLAAMAHAESAGRAFGSPRVVELASAARTALTAVECDPDNLLREHPAYALDLREGVRREVEWLRACGLL